MALNWNRSKPMDDSYPDVGVVVVGLHDIHPTIRSLNRQQNRSSIGQLVTEPPVSLKDVFMLPVSFIIGKSTGPIVPLIVEVQFQFEMRHQFGVQSECDEVMHIRRIFFGFKLVSAVG